jgi:peptide chain release factor 3
VSAAGSRATAQALRRRTVAIVSHPDAGKSTLTEAIAVHAAAITRAGAVHGKPGRKGVVSDWMALERQRGISITTAVLRFGYRDHVINLLDTPGHSDFCEDTYRVLVAVDAAVLLLDAAKGLEPRAWTLYEVCRARRIPVLTFINKWDRPGRDALGLLDEIEQTLRLRPQPITWPVGTAGHPHGLLDCATGAFTGCPRLAPGAIHGETGPAVHAAREELALLRATGTQYDEHEFLAGAATPVLFGAALRNMGVGQLLESLLSYAPGPRPRLDATGRPRALDTSVSGLVFKVQTGMDPHHRDRTAFVRICSGHFVRGMVLTHAATGRLFATKYAPVVVRPTAAHPRRGVPRGHRGVDQRHRAEPGRHPLRRPAGALPTDSPL